MGVRGPREGEHPFRLGERWGLSAKPSQGSHGGVGGQQGGRLRDRKDISIHRSQMSMVGSSGHRVGRGWEALNYLEKLTYFGVKGPFE